MHRSPQNDKQPTIPPKYPDVVRAISGGGGGHTPTSGGGNGESMGAYCFSTTVTFTSGNIHQQSQNQESERLLMIPSNQNKLSLNHQPVHGKYNDTIADSALSNSVVRLDSDNFYWVFSCVLLMSNRFHFLETAANLNSVGVKRTRWARKNRKLCPAKMILWGWKEFLPIKLISFL